MANEIIDPREQGIKGLKGLKGINSNTLSPEAKAFIQMGEMPAYVISQAYTPKEVTNVGLQLAQLGVGDSSYDEDITRLDQAYDVNEYRAQKQPWYSQLANGALKMLTTAGTTVVDNTAGLLAGVVQGINNLGDDDPKTGFWSGMWNNDVTNAMADIQDKMEEIAPNYMSNWEQNAAFYERMFSGAGAANFWGNDILKNAGFTIGTIASLYLTGGISNILKLGNLFKGASNLGKLARWTANSFISSIGESSLESLMAYRDNKKIMENNLNSKTYALQQNIEDEFQDNIANGMSEQDALDIYNYKMQQLNNDKTNYQEAMEADLINASNAVLAANMAALTVSNNLTLGSLIRGGYGNAKSLLDKAVRTVDGKPVASTSTKDIAKGMLNGTLKFETPKITAGAAKVGTHWAATATQEGLEEGIQNIASTTAQMNTQAKMNRWARENSSLGSMINPDADETLADVTKALGAAYEDQFGSANGQGWTEVAAGFITGAFGVAGVHRNKEGKIRPTWQGGIKESYETIYGERNAIQEQIDKLNKALTSGKFGERAKNAAQNLAIKAKQDKALENGDIRAFKNAETEMLVNDALYARDMGLLDSYLEMFNQMASNISEEDIKQLRALASDQRGTSAIDGLTDDEVKQRYQEKAQTTKAKIEEALKEYDLADKHYGNKFSEENRREAIREITYQNTLLWDTYRRMEDIQRDIDKLQQKKNDNTITVAESTELDNKQKAYQSLQKQAINLRDQLNEIKNSPKKLDEQITKLKERRAKIEQYKEAQNAINNYKQATTLGEISEIYALSPEDTREQTLNNAIAQTEDEEIKKNLVQFRDYVGDVGAIEILIDNMFPTDNIENLEKLSPKDVEQSLRNLYLKRIFSQILNNIVDDMLNDETPSLNRQTLKDRLWDKIKEFEEEAEDAKQRARGVKYVEDKDGNYFDLEEAVNNGELSNDDYVSKIDEKTGESKLELGARGKLMQNAALEEFKFNDLKEKLTSIINDMDKIDDLKKTAKKAPKKKSVAKEKRTIDKTSTDEDMAVEEGEEYEELDEDEEDEDEEDLTEKERKKKEKEDADFRKNMKQYLIDAKARIMKIRRDDDLDEDEVKQKVAQEFKTMFPDFKKHGIKFDRTKHAKSIDTLRLLADQSKIQDLFDLDKEIDKLNLEEKEKGKGKDKEKNKGKNKGKKDDKSKGKAPTFDNTNESQIRDSQSSLNGNQFPRYVSKELKENGNVIINTTSQWQKWFMDHNFNFQEILDKYVSKIFVKYKDKKASERPPIYYIHNNDTTVNKLVFIAFKYEDVKDDIPNVAEIITAQDGNKYVLIGTLGTDLKYRPETEDMFNAIYDNIYNEHQEFLDNLPEPQKTKIATIVEMGGTKTVTVTEDTFSLEELNIGDSFIGPQHYKTQLVDSYISDGKKRYLIYWEGQKISVSLDEGGEFTKKVHKIIDNKSTSNTSSEWFVDTQHTNRLKDISDGVLAKRLENDDKQEIRDLRDLLNSNERNPNGLTAEDLQFVIVESTQDKYINYNSDEQKHYEVVKDAKDREQKTGRVYVYGRTARGMMVPIYLETLYLADMEESDKNSPLMQDIVKMLTTLADPNISMDEKKGVIGDLTETLLFTPYVNNIHLNNEESKYFPNTIAITHNGVSRVIIDFNKPTTLEDNLKALDQALIALNPRINIKTSVLSTTPSYYLDSGVLRTNIASLNTVGMNTYLYPVNPQLDYIENKQFKKEITPNGNTRIRKYLNGKPYYYDGQKFFNNTGEEIIDQSLIDELIIIYKIVSGQGNRIKLDNVTYYKINKTYYVSNNKGGFEKATPKEVKAIEYKLENNKKKKAAEEEAAKLGKSKEGDEGGNKGKQSDTGKADKDNKSSDTKPEQPAGEVNKHKGEVKGPKKPQSFNKRIVNSSQLDTNQQTEGQEDLEKMSIFAQVLKQDRRNMRLISGALKEKGKPANTIREIINSLKELNIDTSSNKPSEVLSILKNCR